MSVPLVWSSFIYLLHDKTKRTIGEHAELEIFLRCDCLTRRSDKLFLSRPRSSPQSGPSSMALIESENIVGCQPYQRSHTQRIPEPNAHEKASFRRSNIISHTLDTSPTIVWYARQDFPAPFFCFTHSYRQNMPFSSRSSISGLHFLSLLSALIDQ